MDVQTDTWAKKVKKWQVRIGKDALTLVIWEMILY